MDCAKEAQSQARNGVGSVLVWNNLRDPRNTNKTASEMSCSLEMLPGGAIRTFLWPWINGLRAEGRMPMARDCGAGDGHLSLAQDQSDTLDFQPRPERKV
jgi:hypothetical protein